MSLRTRPNIHHPLLTRPEIRQEPLEIGPNILQNCDERLPQSPNITFYSFLFLHSRYLAVSFLALSSFVSFLFDWPRMFFEKRYHDIPTVSILHFPTSLVFSLFFSPQSSHLFSSSSTPVVLFSTLFFSLLSFILSFSFFLSPHTLHFSLPRFIPLNVHDSKDFYNLQYFISDHFYSLTHIPTSLTGVLGRQIYRQLYWGCTRVKCHRSKFLVCRRRCRVNIAFVTRTSWFIFRVEVIRRPP